ncbi:hypothetical protein M427DRAFT_28649 [Gonapodya prolifera JEL478]|uniref:SAP domain-containing protein n=1 Tax=Gonapodya prolifera (strain JEL478) TaxID=1344416 RepID=A0A139ASJ0_GONPJ|nr:hypothetical protein M427DRAFT_28649 [Gonapodya prolifera JEL478]|eukprot:KXS19712.1 hypothetical protein M427DRAFT_28649 [Gonapodya prolifera JEL478]
MSAPDHAGVAIPSSYAALCALTVPNLKAIAREKKLTVGGTKAELVARIAGALGIAIPAEAAQAATAAGEKRKAKAKEKTTDGDGSTAKRDSTPAGPSAPSAKRPATSEGRPPEPHLPPSKKPHLVSPSQSLAGSLPARAAASSNPIHRPPSLERLTSPGTSVGIGQASNGTVPSHPVAPSAPSAARPLEPDRSDKNGQPPAKAAVAPRSRPQMPKPALRHPLLLPPAAVLHRAPSSGSPRFDPHIERFSLPAQTPPILQTSKAAKLAPLTPPTRHRARVSLAVVPSPLCGAQTEGEVMSVTPLASSNTAVTHLMIQPQEPSPAIPTISTTSYSTISDFLSHSLLSRMFPLLSFSSAPPDACSSSHDFVLGIHVSIFARAEALATAERYVVRKLIEVVGSVDDMGNGDQVLQEVGRVVRGEHKERDLDLHCGIQVSEGRYSGPSDSVIDKIVISGTGTIIGTSATIPPQWAVLTAQKGYIPPLHLVATVSETYPNMISKRVRERGGGDMVIAARFVVANVQERGEEEGSRAGWKEKYGDFECVADLGDRGEGEREAGTLDRSGSGSVRPPKKPQRVVLELPISMAVESVGVHHGPHGSGAPLSRHLAYVQTESGGLFVLKEVGLAVGTEDEMSVMWKMILGCGSRGEDVCGGTRDVGGSATKSMDALVSILERRTKGEKPPSAKQEGGAQEPHMRQGDRQP